MKPEEQLDLWVSGKPVHNAERDECCPDFSCCRPHLLASEEERIAFKNATEGQRVGILAKFLGRLLEDAGHEVVGSSATLF